MTAEIITVLAAFASQFTQPIWKNMQTLFLGAVLCKRVRRVTSILRVMGLTHEKNFSKYHRVLNRASWNGLALSKILLGLLINMKTPCINSLSLLKRQGQINTVHLLLLF